MRVKNIFVNDIELFIDKLIRELIKNEISYVQIDNEIHFGGYIYRFYEKVDICSLINLDLLEGPLNSKRNFFISIEDLNSKDKYISNKNPYSFNKKLIKIQNKNNNRLINTSRKR